MSTSKHVVGHRPVESGDLLFGVIDCTCGYRLIGGVGNVVGARDEYLRHVVREIAADAGWSGEVWAEYTEQDDD